jgi:hypothetical protein
MGVNGQCHVLATLALGRNCGTYLIGCWVGPRTGVDDEKNKTTKNVPLYNLIYKCHSSENQKNLEWLE